MKKEFEKPTVAIIEFSDEDIITGSGDVGDDSGIYWDEEIED